MDPESSKLMQCMEVWGGNQPVEATVQLMGLDVWVHCQPFEGAEGGGDVYYASSCATGRIARILLADVSGHGIAVSGTAISLRELMRKYVNFLDQTEFVRSLNTQFSMLSTEGTFATALALTFFGPTRDLTLCNAGHPPPLLYRSAEKRWDILQAVEGDENFPWGIIENCDYRQLQLPLDVGDLLLCYTDSLCEARASSGDQLGTDGMARLLQRLDADSPERLIGALLEAIRNSGFATSDDVTTVLIRPIAIARERNLWAPWRLLSNATRAAARSLRSGKGFPRPDLKLANIGGVFFARFNRAWHRWDR